MTVLPNERFVLLVAELLRIRWLVSNQPQTRDATTLLIDRDDRFDLTYITQVIDQLSQLHRALNVSTKNNEPTGLHATKKRGALTVEFRPGNTGKDQLTWGSALHTVAS